MKVPATTSDLHILLAAERHHELLRTAEHLRQAAEARGARELTPTVRRTRRRFLRR